MRRRGGRLRAAARRIAAALLALAVLTVVGPSRAQDGGPLRKDARGLVAAARDAAARDTKDAAQTDAPPAGDEPAEPPPREEPATAPEAPRTPAPVAAPARSALPEPSAEPVPSALVAPSTSAVREKPVVEEAPVRLKDRRVFVLRADRLGVSAKDRASRAGKSLERALEEGPDQEVRVEDDGTVAIVFVGKTPIVTLGVEDAEAAGDASTTVHAAIVASSIRSALRSEQIRSLIATNVFHISLVVFAGLVAFLLLRKSSDLSTRGQAWLEAHPESIPTVRIGGVELVGRTGLRGATGVLISVVVRVLQVAVLYVWLVFSLSLFETTHDLSTRTSGFVTRPVGALAERVGTALPLVAITLVAALAVWAVLRFLSLFFGSIARRETWVAWLPPDIAPAAGMIARGGVILLALVFAAPLVTGSDQGALSRVGVAALGAVGLAAIPVLAAACVGAVYVFGRRLRAGDFVEIGRHGGKVREVTLLDTRLEDPQGCEVRVPHLAALWSPARIVGRIPVTEVLVSVDAKAPQGRVREILLATARERDPRAQVRLVRLEQSGASYHLSSLALPEGPDLAVAVAEALAREGIGLGQLSVQVPR